MDYKVTPEQIQVAAQSCDGTAKDVADALNNLKSYVVGTEQWWQGIPQNTFQELMQEYDTYATMLHDALTDIASGLRGNFVNYTEAGQSDINSITNLQNSLGGTGFEIPNSFTAQAEQGLHTAQANMPTANLN
ncbi:WXG100 family type VII secretion target [Streptomyces sp. NPDC052036]|uniref:WXG100 family type VII secretion target n=1 Tax=Streptomyces sp. NPDC052036 TaxID=3155171 RepID=UPI00342CAD3B